jgi:hypothetical protein
MVTVLMVTVFRRRAELVNFLCTPAARKRVSAFAGVTRKEAATAVVVGEADFMSCGHERMPEANRPATSPPAFTARALFLPGIS